MNPAAGSLKGHVCISGNVAEGTDGFVLNRGLNIRAVTDAATGELIEFDRAETPASNDQALLGARSGSNDGARQERLEAFARDCLVPQVGDRCLADPAN